MDRTYHSRASLVDILNLLFWHHVELIDHVTNGAILSEGMDVGG